MTVRQAFHAVASAGHALLMPGDYHVTGRPQYSGDYTVPPEECSLCHPDNGTTGLLCSGCIGKAAGYDRLVDDRRTVMRRLRVLAEFFHARGQSENIAAPVYAVAAEEIDKVLVLHFSTKMAQDDAAARKVG